MLPIAPLMIEHRLIERMILVMQNELNNIESKKIVDVVLIDKAVDFIRTYADQCHHGKEEDILFRDLSNKQLSKEHKQTMEELIQEHIYGRNTVKKLVSAKESFEKGDKAALAVVKECLVALVNFYPKHIDKEDNHFFIPCMDYFSEVEKDALLKESWEFDQAFIHIKYKKMVENLE
jgi:hemerythrin-like domain-containing protein